jgi:hypothetical protein
MGSRLEGGILRVDGLVMDLVETANYKLIRNLVIIYTRMTWKPLQLNASIERLKRKNY